MSLHLGDSLLCNSLFCQFALLSLSPSRNILLLPRTPGYSLLFLSAENTEMLWYCDCFIYLFIYIILNISRAEK